MTLSIVFIILDVLAVTAVLHIGGLNPFWKFAFIFKCFTDTIILDDFKTVLDKLFLYKQNQMQADLSLSDRRATLSTADVQDSKKLEENLHVIHVETEIEIAQFPEPPRQTSPEGSTKGLITTGTRAKQWSADSNV